MSDESNEGYALFTAFDGPEWFASDLNQRMREDFEIEGEPTRRGQFGSFILRNLTIDCDEPVSFPSSARDVEVECCRFRVREGVAPGLLIPAKVTRVLLRENVVTDTSLICWAMQVNKED